MEPEIVYMDKRVLVAVKPSGVLSTDEPGGMPELLRLQLGDPQACVRTVHRLDQVVGGLMVFARSAVAASRLSKQIREHSFVKTYLAVIHGRPEPDQGTLKDLLYRSRTDRMTYVVPEHCRGAQEAELSYRVLDRTDTCSLVEIRLGTGRTHQIRVQFSSRGMPLVGDRKYGNPEETCGIALWSSGIGFHHPESGKWMTFSQTPPERDPWSLFSLLHQDS